MKIYLILLFITLCFLSVNAQGQEIKCSFKNANVSQEIKNSAVSPFDFMIELYLPYYYSDRNYNNNQAEKY